MIQFTNKRVSRTAARMDSYLRNFSEALLNWEQNKQEARFAFSLFDDVMRKDRKPKNY